MATKKAAKKKRAAPTKPMVGNVADCFAEMAANGKKKAAKKAGLTSVQDRKRKQAATWADKKDNLKTQICTLAAKLDAEMTLSDFHDFLEQDFVDDIAEMCNEHGDEAKLGRFF